MAKSGLRGAAIPDLHRRAGERPALNKAAAKRTTPRMRLTSERNNRSATTGQATVRKLVRDSRERPAPFARYMNSIAQNAELFRAFPGKQQKKGRGWLCRTWALISKPEWLKPTGLLLSSKCIEASDPVPDEAGNSSDREMQESRSCWGAHLSAFNGQRWKRVSSCLEQQGLVRSLLSHAVTVKNLGAGVAPGPRLSTKRTQWEKNFDQDRNEHPDSAPDTEAEISAR